MRAALTVLCVLLGVGVGCAQREQAPAAGETPAAGGGTPRYTPAKVSASVAPYSVKPDLGNVSNLKQFGELTAAQKALLAKNGFFAAPSRDQQLYFAYERNDYLLLPNFVACDAVLQLYHIFFDYSLRQVEADRLIPLCEGLTSHMYDAALADWKAAKSAEVKQAALKNVAYFGVAMRVLELDADLPPAAAKMVRAELDLIAKHQGRLMSAIFPYCVDYSQFVPRGHYTRNEAFKRYFKAMMWYGLVPFPVEFEGKTMYEQMRQSLLIARALYETKLDGKPALETWERIYEPTVFYVESADDLTPAEWRDTAIKVWGHLPGPAELAGKAKLDEFCDLAKQLRGPRIATFAEDAPEKIFCIPTGHQFRVMGQREIPDSYMLQQLVWSNVGTFGDKRRFPRGLDITAALGSERAYWILDTVYDEPHYAHYDERLDNLKREFAAKTGEDWRQNLYWGWLWTLKSLLEPAPEGYPSFMRNDAWLDKSLHTVLASWAEMRHDTILYAKQSCTAECGDGGPEEQPPVPKGYVEPAVETYHRMVWLNAATREGLRDRDLLTPALDESFGQMDDLLTFLERISIKELTGEKITDVEYNQIRTIGAWLESTTNTITRIMDEQGLVTDTDDDMAVVADVHTAFPKCLEEGVGRAYHIYVVAPIEGKLVLTRGAIFSYYEFPWPISDRLTDEKWQEILQGEQAPKPPEWTATFLSGPKTEIPVPKKPRITGGC